MTMHHADIVSHRPESHILMRRCTSWVRWNQSGTTARARSGLWTAPLLKFEASKHEALLAQVLARVPRALLSGLTRARALVLAGQAHRTLCSSVDPARATEKLSSSNEASGLPSRRTRMTSPGFAQPMAVTSGQSLATLGQNVDLSHHIIGIDPRPPERRVHVSPVNCSPAIIALVGSAR